MTALFQNVKNITQQVKTKISPYLYGLLLHDNSKTCTSMMRQLSVPFKRMYSSLGMRTYYGQQFCLHPTLRLNS